MQPASDQAWNQEYEAELFAFHREPRSALRRQSRFMSFRRRLQRKKHASCFASQEAGQRGRRGACKKKHSMDQRGSEKPATAGCVASTIKFSENSECLRIFGGHRLGVSPSFLMRDSSVVGLTSRSAAAPFDPRIRQLHCSTACRIIARSASSSDPAVALTATGRSVV